jgi:hypothetical protein
MERRFKPIPRRLRAGEHDGSRVELGIRTWLAAGLVPGLSPQPLKKLGADARALLKVLRRWQGEATKADSTINRVVVAFEVGRDGFWLAHCGADASAIRSIGLAWTRAWACL